MTTEHNNFLTVISKEVALQYQTVANLLKDAISDSILTSYDRAEKRLRMRHLRPSRRVVGGKISTQATNS